MRERSPYARRGVRPRQLNPCHLGQGTDKVYKIVKLDALPYICFAAVWSSDRSSLPVAIPSDPSRPSPATCLERYDYSFQRVSVVDPPQSSIPVQ